MDLPDNIDRSLFKSFEELYEMQKSRKQKNQ